MSEQPDPRISRRRALQLGVAAVPAAVLAACGEPAPADTASAGPSGLTGRSTTATATSSPIAASPAPASHPVLFRGAALADGRSSSLRRGVSVLVSGGVVRWIRPADGEEEAKGAEVVDAAGATIVPGMVDAHSHVTGPGGANWITRFNDPPERLLAYAEANARLAWGAGVRWLRDVGSPVRHDPLDGRNRALAIGIRDRWKGKSGYPVIRAAGSWLTRAGSLPAGLAVEVENADQLLAAAIHQLDDGADLVKLYLDGPDPTRAPWSVAEVGRVVSAVHARKRKVTAHALRLSGAAVGAAAGVDALEHGFELDASTARAMVRRGIVLVSTLSVLRSWISFGSTTRVPRFAAPGRTPALRAQLENAEASIRLANRAGVKIAAGTDFGGGSPRANHLPWEFSSLIAAGLEPVDALAAVTWRGGELLGERDAGVIREGRPATFFTVHGDPLTDPDALWRVWRHA
jgi:imidazolonepropionase-like amidohydrolase